MEFGTLLAQQQPEKEPGRGRKVRREARTPDFEVALQASLWCHGVAKEGRVSENWQAETNVDRLEFQ